jgi:hypothetical protein
MSAANETDSYSPDVTAPGQEQSAVTREGPGLIAFLLGPHGRNITGQAIVQCAGASL